MCSQCVCVCVSNPLCFCFFFPAAEQDMDYIQSDSWAHQPQSVLALPGSSASQYLTNGQEITGLIYPLQNE